MRRLSQQRRGRPPDFHNVITRGRPLAGRLAAMVERYQAGDLEVRPQEHLALARGRALTLSVREFDLLVALAREQGRIITRDGLYAAVWGGTLRHDDRSVDVYVHKLRGKLAAALPEWRFIHTHFGFGYRFSPEPAFTPFSQGEHSPVTGSAPGP
jgi:DNA-binding response OmpR family regulator